jgi:ABC-type transporter Mla subunit MlaD
MADQKHLCPQITAHQSDFSNLLQSVADKWNETATTLQDHTPEVRKTAQELQTSFNSGLQSFFEQAQKVSLDLLRCRVVVNSKISPLNANTQRIVLEKRTSSSLEKQGSLSHNFS